MMRALPLYPSNPALPVLDKFEPLPLAPGCRSCDLGAPRPKGGPCMRPEGSPGGLLVLGASPTRVEEALGRPFSSDAGRHIRDLIKKYWSGPIALDYAIRCAPGSTEIKDRHKKACSYYLAQVLEDVQPSRIIAFGALANEMLMQVNVYVHAQERSYSYVELNGSMIPVFHLQSLTLNNRFMLRDFEEELQWALTSDPANNLRGSYKIINDERDAVAAVDEMLASGQEITVDTETHGRHANTDFWVICAATHARGSDCVYVWPRQFAANRKVAAQFKRLLTSDNVRVAASNGKYDENSIFFDKNLNFVINETASDTRLMRKVLDPSADASLDVMAYMVGLGGHKHEAEDLIADIKAELRLLAKDPEPAYTPTGKLRKTKTSKLEGIVPDRTIQQVREGTDEEAFCYEYLPDDVLHRYVARDVWTTSHCADRFASEIAADPRMVRVWELVREANRSVAELERNGFPVDKHAVQIFSQYCQSMYATNEKALAVYGKFNANSPKQVAEFIYDKLKLKHTIRGKPPRSTDKEVLAALETKHPAMAALGASRKYLKLDSNYAGGMLPKIRDDMRIHASYLLDGAESGRMSCSDPNMQNIPRAKGSSEAKMSRACFVAPPGYKLLEADFSQVELRVAAMLARDTVMIDDFRRGIDIHAENARLSAKVAWNIEPHVWAAMSKDDRDPYRSKIKTSTFAKLYGKSIRGLAKQLRCSEDEAAYLVKQIWGRYKILDAWTRDMVREARKTGETWTWWDGEKTRRRYIYGIAHPDDGIAAHYERVSYNNAVQGTANEFCLASVSKIRKESQELDFDAQLVGTVHDSILSIVREEELPYYARMKRAAMMSFNSEGVPLAVDLKVGDNWGELEDYDPDKKEAA